MWNQLKLRRSPWKSVSKAVMGSQTVKKSRFEHSLVPGRLQQRGNDHTSAVMQSCFAVSSATLSDRSMDHHSHPENYLASSWLSDVTHVLRKIKLPTNGLRETPSGLSLCPVFPCFRLIPSSLICDIIYELQLVNLSPHVWWISPTAWEHFHFPQISRPSHGATRVYYVVCGLEDDVSSACGETGNCCSWLIPAEGADCSLAGRQQLEGSAEGHGGHPTGGAAVSVDWKREQSLKKQQHRWVILLLKGSYFTSYSVQLFWTSTDHHIDCISLYRKGESHNDATQIICALSTNA